MPKLAKPPVRTKKRQWAYVLVVVLVVGICVVNLVPYTKGMVNVECADDFGDWDRRPVVNMGVPFAYLQHSKGVSECPYDAGFSGSPQTYNRFNSAALWFDLLVWGGVVLGAYYLLGKWEDTQQTASKNSRTKV